MASIDTAAASILLAAVFVSAGQIFRVCRCCPGLLVLDYFLVGSRFLNARMSIWEE